jgi:hypothetical protein
VRPLRLTATRRHRARRRGGRGAAIAALVLAASVALVASSAARAHDALTTPTREARLPIPPRSPAPVAVLYINRHCPLCQRSARLTDSLGAALHLPTLVVTNDSPKAARQYSASLGLRQSVTIDSSGALARAARVRAVPALILIDHGRQFGEVIYGTLSAATLAADLESVRTP